MICIFPFQFPGASQVPESLSMSSQTGVGDPAPDFTATTADGQSISLQDYRGRKSVVLFFYPRDDSPVCTLEACRFRDEYEDFVSAGAVVIGVSSDSAESHLSFAGKHKLPFPLISDADGALRRIFGVPRSLMVLPGRVTYVIDPAGTVRLVFNSQLQGERHVEEALAMVRSLKSAADDAPKKSG